MRALSKNNCILYSLHILKIVSTTDKIISSLLYSLSKKQKKFSHRNHLMCFYMIYVIITCKKNKI